MTLYNIIYDAGLDYKQQKQHDAITAIIYSCLLAQLMAI